MFRLNYFPGICYQVITQQISVYLNSLYAFSFKKNVGRCAFNHPRLILASLKETEYDIVGDATVFCRIIRETITVVDAYARETCKPHEPICVLEDAVDMVAYQTIIC